MIKNDEPVISPITRVVYTIFIVLVVSVYSLTVFIDVYSPGVIDKRIMKWRTNAAVIFSTDPSARGGKK